MLNEVGQLMREALLDEYEAVTDPTHRRVINWALARVSCYSPHRDVDWLLEDYTTPREYWEGDRLPPVVRRLGRAWFQRCCGARVERFSVVGQRVTITGVVKPRPEHVGIWPSEDEVRWCRLCGERAG